VVELQPDLMHVWQGDTRAPPSTTGRRRGEDVGIRLGLSCSDRRSEKLKWKGSLAGGRAGEEPRR